MELVEYLGDGTRGFSADKSQVGFLISKVPDGFLMLHSRLQLGNRAESRPDDDSHRRIVLSGKQLSGRYVFTESIKRISKIPKLQYSAINGVTCEN